MNTTETTLTVPAFACSNASTLTTPKGKACGTRYSFAQHTSASECRKALKAADSTLKGSALDAKVNAVLRGDAPLANMLAHAFVVSESARGVVWTVAESRTKGSILKGVLTSEAVATPAKPDLATMTNEEKLALLAELQASMTA